ncbi:MAG: hypothetical protein OEW60_03280 [Thiovulaceae bacterium]|nr:hypothetical protein [Sulfurimonadaceae bacterium]
MSYTQWFQEHGSKHRAIIEKLLKRNLSKKEIIDYFDFESMVKNEADFCPLYKEEKKCHDLESLNCYLCACPNFRFKDSGFNKVEDKTRYSFCDIESKDGRVGIYGEAIHQDCSKCTVPHHRSYVEKHFDLNWFDVMKPCKNS